MRGIRSWRPPAQGAPQLRARGGRQPLGVSMGVGLLAIFAARMAARGEKVFAIAQRLREMAPRLHILFAVDTLDYLERGGRIGKAQAWVGKLLAIKPILGRGGRRGGASRQGARRPPGPPADRRAGARKGRPQEADRRLRRPRPGPGVGRPAAQAARKKLRGARKPADRHRPGGRHPRRPRLRRHRLLPAHGRRMAADPPKTTPSCLDWERGRLARSSSSAAPRSRAGGTPRAPSKRALHPCAKFARRRPHG